MMERNSHSRNSPSRMDKTDNVEKAAARTKQLTQLAEHLNGYGWKFKLIKEKNVQAYERPFFGCPHYGDKHYCSAFIRF